METTNSLNDKIVTIIEALGLSNTKFADSISVSRPTISHIISGRNKPSIDIVQKIITKYPELGYRWFLDDEEFDPEKLKALKDSQEVTDTGERISSQKVSTQQNSLKELVVKKTISQESAILPTSKRSVEKVIMFYSDGSMEVLSGSPQVL